MGSSCPASRRHFLKSSILGGLAAATAGQFTGLAQAATADAALPGKAAQKARVALTTGNDRADNVFRGMKEFAHEIAEAIGDRPVVVKPNNVAIDIPLCATHADHLAGILEFLKSIGKLENAVIAESAASGPTMEGFDNYGYLAVAKKYGVKLVDLDTEPTETLWVYDEKDFRPHAVRMARRLLDPKTYIISAAKFKTHDRIVATLSLKNIIFGAPIKDLGFRWGKKGKPGLTIQKPIAHGSGYYGINYNLFTLAQRFHPHLSVIDGFEGMEGNGPTGGTPVDHRVAVVSPDWLAADRVAVELMGIDFAKVGYLNFCAQARMGEADLARMDILGEPVARHVRTYKLSKSIDKQLMWMNAPKWS